MKDITTIGFTDWRNQRQQFGIKDADRLRHIYAIGKTGTGKSTLLLNMAISDIKRGHNICVIDPHGDLVNELLHHIPRERINDTIYFDVTDAEYSIAFNPLADVEKGNFSLVTSGLISTFKKIWSDSWGPRLEHILRFSLLTLLHAPKATLLDIQPLLTDAYFRNGMLRYVTDSFILAFWKNEFDKYAPPFRSEAIAPILNKMGLFTASLPLRHVIGQEHSAFTMQEIIDGRKILICNLSKGQTGEEASAILGSMLLTAIQSAALFRASYDPANRIPFYLYVDEMHSFVTLSFIDVLAEARKYGIGIFLTHQYIEQLHEDIRAAIIGNVGTLISFRIGSDDAAQLVKEFQPVFNEEDLVSLPRFAMYLKLMVDGTASKPFSAISCPLPVRYTSYSADIIAASRTRYGKRRDAIDEEIARRYSIKANMEQDTLFA